MKIEVYPDDNVVARKAAAIVADAARAAVAAQGRFVMAVSGGHTPWVMLRALAGKDLPWNEVSVVQTDERIARFEPSAERPDDDYTWWTYSVGLYREVLAILGFRIEKISYANYYHEYAGRFEERPTVVAVRE